MIKLLQSPWVATALGTVLYLAMTVFCWQPRGSSPIEAPSAPPRKAGPSWTFHNPEVDQLVGELKRERETLGEKEKQLNELALRLQTERQELNQITQAVHQLQVEFDRNVVKIEEQESANLKKLSKVYASMAPENAVGILKQMEEITQVKIMALMKDSETAPLLEAMGKLGEAEAKHAANLSERLRMTLSKPAAAPAPNQ